MKKYFCIVIVAVLCILCLVSCNEDTGKTDNSEANNLNNISSFDLDKVNNLKCKVRFGETKEEITFEKEKALELHNIIVSCDYTKLDGMSVKSSVNPSTDYVYLHFTGDEYSEELPTKEYGHYTVYTDDIAVTNLSVFMSYAECIQCEDGLYDSISRYINENRG